MHLLLARATYADYSLTKSREHRVIPKRMQGQAERRQHSEAVQCLLIGMHACSAKI